MIMTGFIAPLVYLRVVDAAGNDVPKDGRSTGEIIVRAPWCTQGYYKEPEKSEELWAGGWMHTGDVAYMDEYGYIQIVDRLKDVIKSGGEWIVSQELENLLSLHEGVLEAAVIGIPDEKWGERPLAIVVPREEYKGKLTGDMLRAHLNRYVEEGLITSWSVPENYTFVDELPKTSVGKIDKKVLRSRFGAA
jgi:fatty-acyl-CoA synthase